MENRLLRLKNFVEYQAFGVCSKIGEKMGIASGKIRLWFIYISFLTLGSPIIIYMILAFFMNIRNYILLRKRNPLRF
ncbi:PspC family transcriptional regulator [Taibaiella sp. KBW10]|uniref:PspC domain-containing protein n=1 Tax=Taibaiella sp. KBW10 TaxID=2153357 RepID=UPI000F5953D3|nr:PspC domain-containing protein [Taibaiella sp. KBW10]RQO31090.1 PspC family transcriptional regulator [Taibaiella sp. KBW10]